MRPWEVLNSEKTYQLAEYVDKEIVEKAQSEGCPQEGCGGPLYRADYPRKPRGPYEVRAWESWQTRFSVCCGKEGCRKRHTPPSVRFFGRRWYVGVAVLLVSVVSSGGRSRRVEMVELVSTLEVDARTVKRWKAWWRNTFVQTKFWRAARGLLKPESTGASALQMLWAQYGGEREESVVALLRFLSPVTVSGACAGCAK